MSTSETRVPSAQPTPDEAADLRDEIDRLRAALAERDAPSRRGWWRPVVCGVMIALAAVLAPLSVLATWASGQVQDTDRYIATVAPLADDPAVQQAIAARMEEVLFSYLDLDAATDELVSALEGERLPPRAAETLRALSGPLTSGVEGFVRDKIDDLVASDAFEAAWIEAHRTAHDELVAALTGETDGSVTVDGRGRVSVNVAALINTVKGELTRAGFGMADRIPEVQASFVILQSDDLVTLQRVLTVLDDLTLWLPVLVIALVIGAVVLASDRSRALLAAGLAVAASMVVLGVTLNVLRPYYLGALPADVSVAAAGAVYDQLVSYIRVALRGVLVVALTVAVIAWLSARGGSGATARRALSRSLAAMRRRRVEAGWSTGRVGLVLGQYRGAARASILGVAALSYLAQDQPTGATALTIVLVGAALLLVVELVATDSAAPSGPGASTT